MTSYRSAALVLVGALASMGASHPTTNFLVEAPTPQIAQQIGQFAEKYRKEKAIEWLGQEMPNWPERCPLRVKVTMTERGGATSFAFDRGRVLGQHMNIEGSLDRLLASVLPHEVTHTVFAYYFRTPVPRWADEGGAVLSEDDIERNRHDQLVRQILNSGRAMRLRTLFGLREYPNEVMTLYAEGYSVVQYLVDRSRNRRAFLEFIAQGMSAGWDAAARTHFGYNNVEELEQAWLAHLRATKRRPDGQLASNTAGAGEERQAVRLIQTLPPSQPLSSAPTPIVRGQSPDPRDGRYSRAGGRPSGRPGYLPDYGPSLQPPPPTPSPSWQPAGPQTAVQPSVRLGSPQFNAPTAPPQERPASVFSPVGYPE